MPTRHLGSTSKFWCLLEGWIPELLWDALCHCVAPPISAGGKVALPVTHYQKNGAVLVNL